MKYTLIAYKPDSDDYCRGCHMASYKSGHVVHYNMDHAELLKQLIKIEKENLELQINETGWEITIFGNSGLLFAEWSHSDLNDYDTEDLDDVAYEALGILEKDIAALVEEARVIAKKSLAAQKEAQERIEQEKRTIEREENKKRKVESEIAHLRELAAKYPDIFKKD